jgi:acyl dehydratase
MSTSSREPLYLDDLKVGDTFRTQEQRVDVADIKRFAAEYDPQPFHLDDSAAEQSIFKGLAASGWHTASITMRLLVGSGPPLANGILGVGIDLAWPAPTRPGDVLHVEVEVARIEPSRSRSDRGTVALATRTLNQRGQVVQKMTATLLLFRRP